MAICEKTVAQDIIHTLDGRSIEAKVFEINEDIVLYKSFDNLEGPDYRMSASLIDRIVFQNGAEKTLVPFAIRVPPPCGYDNDGPYGPLMFRRGRLYADQLSDHWGVSLYGSDWLKARSQYRWGMSLTIAGAATLISSLVCGAMLSDFNRGVEAMGMNGRSTSSLGALYVAGGITGVASIAAGTTLWIKGNKKLNTMADDYNKRCGGKENGYVTRFGLGTTGQGFGLALCF